MSNIILCADDSKTMQTVAEITFRASDFQYVGATSADDALTKARAEKPALILADAVMPGKTGYELCKMVKADPELADVPVIMLCGNAAAYDAAKGSDAGADGHLSKPWDTQVMLDKVAEFVTTTGGSAGRAATGAPSTATATIDKIKRPRLGTPPPLATPSATPRPPITPKPPATPAPNIATSGKARDAGPSRTHTIMGMPTVMPPGPTGPGGSSPAIPPPTPTAKPPRPPGITAKPGMPPRPVIPQQPPQQRRPATVPSKYAPPAMKSAITKPGVPDPPRPAPSIGEGDIRSTSAIASQLGPSGVSFTPQPPVVPPPPPVVTPAPPVVAPASAAPPPPVSPPMAPTAEARPSVAQPLGRPPMIRGLPARMPAFVAPAALRQIDVTGVTRRAVRHAAADAGLAADGPEVKALLALSHDVVERVIWEIVPDLAEAIIRENLHTLTSKHS
jgi:CheY-like chemotaxis protein